MAGSFNLLSTTRRHGLLALRENVKISFLGDFSSKSIRKGYLLCQNGKQKGQELDLEAAPPQRKTNVKALPTPERTLHRRIGVG